jgi:hypothetical protein
MSDAPPHRNAAGFLALARLPATPVAHFPS